MKIILPLALLLAGCTTNMPDAMIEPPKVQESAINLKDYPKLSGQKMTIAVYEFQDKTGQRKPSDNTSNLSSAVTQGAESWVIDALHKVGGGTYFDVVERTGMNNVITERQLVRNTRESYQEEDNLPPMVFAGLIVEGGIIGYDSNNFTKGTGARLFGIGSTEQYRVDTVTVALRLVSVNTGMVLLSTSTEKSIASYQQSADVFTFIDLGTQSIEIENGYSKNEPVNYAVRAAIEQAVLEMLKEGEQQGLWKTKGNTNE